MDKAGQAQTQAMLEFLVLDSGAIIRGHGFSFKNVAKKIYSIPEVIAEIRDSKSRLMLESLPYEIELRQPSDASMKAVADFARKTGDFSALSLTDLKVIALTYTLEAELNGIAHIKTNLARNIRNAANSKQPTPATKAAATPATATPVAQSSTNNPTPLVTENGDTSNSTENLSVQELDNVDEAHIESLTEDESDQNDTASSGPEGNANPDDVEKSSSEVLVDDSDSDGDGNETDEDNIIDEADFPVLGAPKSKSVTETKPSSSWANMAAAAASKPVPTARPAWLAQSTQVIGGAAEDNENNKPATSANANTRCDTSVESATSHFLEPPKPAESSISLSLADVVDDFYNGCEITGTLDPCGCAERAASVKSQEGSTRPHIDGRNGSNDQISNEAVPQKPVATKTAVPTKKTDMTEVNTTSRILTGSGFTASGASREASVRAAKEDDGEGWVNPSNIANVKAKGAGMYASGADTVAVSADTKTACVTTDFSMQNVMLQMGLHVMSVDGMLVQRVKQFVLRCVGCFQVHYQMDRLFCSRCGGSHLHRIAASIDAKTGQLRLHLKKNYQKSLQGTKYNLPKPGNAGKYEGEILLREDQLFSGVWKQKVVKIRKDVRSAFGEDITSDIGVQINKGNSIMVGYGRRNPNAEKGRERRGKKKR
jgi:rRNA maturation endonuclease Nob1